MSTPSTCAVSPSFAPEPTFAMSPPERSPCCVPSNQHLAQLTNSTRQSAQRARATSGSLENMVRLNGGPFRMVAVSPFYISKFSVTNEQFDAFVRHTGYCTEAERFGWSFVFRNHVNPNLRGTSIPC